MHYDIISLRERWHDALFYTPFTDKNGKLLDALHIQQHLKQLQFKKIEECYQIEYKTTLFKLFYVQTAFRRRCSNLYRSNEGKLNKKT